MMTTVMLVVHRVQQQAGKGHEAYMRTESNPARNTKVSQMLATSRQQQVL
jgi:hypothetical protein